MNTVSTILRYQYTFQLITVKALEIVLLFQNSLTVCMATSTGPSTTTSQQQLWCLYPDGKLIKLMCCLLDVYPVYASLQMYL